MSLPQKISSFVVLATLLSSLIVTATSVHYLQGFLRAKLAEKFPVILTETGDRLERWLEQLPVDVETFAASETVVENFASLRRGGGSRKSTMARQEIRDYLTQVLRGIPQYSALVILDLTGRELLWAGNTLTLREKLRLELAKVEEPRVGDLRRIAGHRVQIVSAPVRDATGTRVGSLHAVLRPETIQHLLKSDLLGASGRIYLLRSDGTYLTPMGDHDIDEHYVGKLPQTGSMRRPISYRDPGGRRLVGAAKRVGPLDWTLVVEESYDQIFAPILRAAGPILLINIGAVLISSVFSFWLSHALASPIQALSDGARRIAEGETDVVILERRSHDEIGLLTRTFNRMSAHLRRNQLELEESQEKLEKANLLLQERNNELQKANLALEELSITDGLTRLKNHRYFQEHLQREIACAELSEEPLSLILIDIDCFKQLNDRYGHATGDRVLQGVAECMRGLVRQSDVLARYGGEEFALVPRGAPPEVAIRLAEKIRLTVAAHEFRSDSAMAPTERIAVTVSVGVATFRGDAGDLFGAADRALYSAKERGRDCVVVDGEES
ncbi:MAG: diguanylate cyclase [Myxococcota bacterium]